MKPSHIQCDCGVYIPVVDGITDCRCGQSFDVQLFNVKWDKLYPIPPIYKKWESYKWEIIPAQKLKRLYGEG